MLNRWAKWSDCAPGRQPTTRTGRPRQPTATRPGLGDAEVVTLRDFVYHLRQARGSVAAVVHMTRRSAPQILRSINYVLRLPCLPVTLGDSETGREISEVLSKRRWLIPAWVAVAVLELPA